MNSNAQRLLRDAFERQALVALFIDLTQGFLNGWEKAGEFSVKPAFDNSNRIAAKLRKKSVPIVWCASPNLLEPSEGTLRDFQDVLTWDHRLVPKVHENEKIFTKTESNLMQTPQALRYFKSLDNPVILVGGVWANACVAHTISGMFRSMSEQQLRIIALRDCIDLFWEDLDYKAYIKLLSEQKSNDDNFSILKSNDVLRTLPNNTQLLPRKIRNTFSKNFLQPPHIRL